MIDRLRDEVTTLRDPAGGRPLSRKVWERYRAIVHEEVRDAGAGKPALAAPSLAEERQPVRADGSVFVSVRRPPARSLARCVY